MVNLPHRLLACSSKSLQLQTWLPTCWAWRASAVTCRKSSLSRSLGLPDPANAASAGVAAATEASLASAGSVARETSRRVTKVHPGHSPGPARLFGSRLAPAPRQSSGVQLLRVADPAIFFSCESSCVGDVPAHGAQNMRMLLRLSFLG